MNEDWKTERNFIKVNDISNIANSASIYSEDDWIVDLAQKEDNIEKTGLISFDDVNTPEKFLQGATIDLLIKLRQRTIKLINVFNNSKSQTSSSIKLYRINNTEADFMVFRNALKLIFSIQRPGVLEVSFNVSSASLYSNLGISNNEKVGDLIQAQLGPFNEAVWTFQGIRINLEIMLKYYLTKFIQNSVR
jgi:hypothetical protein